MEFDFVASFCILCIRHIISVQSGKISDLFILVLVSSMLYHKTAFLFEHRAVQMEDGVEAPLRIPRKRPREEKYAELLYDAKRQCNVTKTIRCILLVCQRVYNIRAV